MTGRSRRAVLLGTAATLGVPGCAALDRAEPPDVDWRVEEAPDRVEFVHDGGELVDAPHRLVVRPHEATGYSVYRDDERVEQDLPLFRPSYRVDGEFQSYPPERLAEGDALIARARHVEAYFTDGGAFELLWRDVGGPVVAVTAEDVREEVLATEELTEQREAPPEADWTTEQTDGVVRFVHEGGDSVYGPAGRDLGQNGLGFDFGPRRWEYPKVRGEARWIEAGDALAFPYEREGVEPGTTVRLVWKNRHGTREAVLASHVVE